MPLLDYCVSGAILSDMEASDKEDAIRQLISALAESGKIPASKVRSITTDVLGRERQATTGIGQGVGVPHARSKHVSEIRIAIGKVASGLDFEAVDGERVRVILLIISPAVQAKAEEHLQVMKSIVKIVRDPYQCKRLHGCTTPESFLDLLAELDRGAYA